MSVHKELPFFVHSPMLSDGTINYSISPLLKDPQLAPNLFLLQTGLQRITLSMHHFVQVHASNKSLRWIPPARMFRIC